MRLLLLTSSLLLAACPSTGGTFYEAPTPEPTPDEEPTPGEESRMAWVQLQRSWELGGGATLRAVASFHSPADYAVWPTDSAELDGCTSGVSDVDEWSVPASNLDVGTPVLYLGDEELALDFDGTHWSRQLSTSYWEQHQEFTFRVTGGPDLPAQFYEAVVGSPATLTLEGFEEGPDGLSLTWTGANNDGDIRVLVYSESDPIDWLYCRLNDDGAHLLARDVFEGVLPDGDYIFEARRQRSVDFEMGEYPGTTLGLSTATADLFVSSASRDSSGGR